MNPSTSTTWHYLEPNPRSCYKQLFLKGTRIRARVLYGMYASADEPLTPEAIAAEFDLPLEAVKEAIAYCQSNPPEIAQDFERESGPYAVGSGYAHNLGRWKMSTVLPPIIGSPTGDFPTISILLTPAVPMTQDQFFDFCQLNADKRFERTADGELIIMAPTGGDAAFRTPKFAIS